MSFILKFSFGKLLLPTGTKSIASPLIAFQKRDLAKLPPSFEVGGGGLSPLCPAYTYYYFSADVYI